MNALERLPGGRSLGSLGLRDQRCSKGKLQLFVWVHLAGREHDGIPRWGEGAGEHLLRESGGIPGERERVGMHLGGREQGTPGEEGSESISPGWCHWT